MATNKWYLISEEDVKTIQQQLQNAFDLMCPSELARHCLKEAQHSFDTGLHITTAVPSDYGPSVNEQLEMVRDFHHTFNIPAQDRLKAIGADHNLIKLRTRLVMEELQEVEIAALNCLDTELAKELSDLLYVVLGTFVTFGLVGETQAEVFQRVHDSNMSKLGADGRPIFREDGKLLKGPNYQPPNLSDIF